MALAKTATTLINSVTVAASGVQDSAASLDLSAAIDLAIGYTMTFNASAGTYGARIELFADPTGANSSFSIGTYDDCVDSWDIPGDAGHTVNGLVPMMKCGKYVKARIVNLSTSQTITAATLTGIVQTA